MRIAVPIEDGRLSMHFGHCKLFALIDVDEETKQIIRREDIEAPPHEPGILPKWLAERDVTLIIASGMGHRALRLFSEIGIRVEVGASEDTPEKLVGQYVKGDLKLGNNICDH